MICSFGGLDIKRNYISFFLPGLLISIQIMLWIEPGLIRLFVESFWEYSVKFSTLDHLLIGWVKITTFESSEKTAHRNYLAQKSYVYHHDKCRFGPWIYRIGNINIHEIGCIRQVDMNINPPDNEFSLPNRGILVCWE